MADDGRFRKIEGRGRCRAGTATGPDVECFFGEGLLGCVRRRDRTAEKLEGITVTKEMEEQPQRGRTSSSTARSTGSTIDLLMRATWKSVERGAAAEA